MLTILVKLLKALNSEQSASQLAAAISLAVILGLTPILSLHNGVILLIALWFRVNLSLLIISYPLFALIGFLMSPLFDSIGLSVLQLPSLVPLWESFFNTIIGRWSNFYYSGVMGSFVVSLLLAIVLFPIAKMAITAYRDRWLEYVDQFKVVKMLKASKLWQMVLA